MATPDRAAAVRALRGAQTDDEFFYGGAMAVSPDGRWMVFRPGARMASRVIGFGRSTRVEARPLPGTEGAFVPAAWTSDSRYVVFSLASGDLAVEEGGYPGWAAADVLDEMRGGLQWGHGEPRRA